jgi:hypothetical protein
MGPRLRSPSGQRSAAPHRQAAGPRFAARGRRTASIRRSHTGRNNGRASDAIRGPRGGRRRIALQEVRAWDVRFGGAAPLDCATAILLPNDVASSPVESASDCRAPATGALFMTMKPARSKCLTRHVAISDRRFGFAGGARYSAYRAPNVGLLSYVGSLQKRFPRAA